jgi:NitT/TauT family transport system ATP-binding protein/nitrate/nitrite transport system substrate-binding protein
MTTLTLGFVPLIDAAPLIAAQAKSFFTAEGLSVTLSREAAWATVRDKLAVGALDGAHLLAPLALASTLGLGGHATPLVAPLALNRGGAAVTLSTRIAGGADAAAGLRRVVALRREQGVSPLTFAVVFPHSIHAYLLRRWLSDAGVDPERDVRLTVAPPPRMAELLADGVIEGFAAGEPWSAAAVAEGSGRVAARAGEVWPAAPDKVFATTQASAEREPAALAALIRAIVRAADWCAAPANRTELVGLLARPEHVGVAIELIAAGLEEVRFGAGVAEPTDADANWLVGQMSHWGELTGTSGAASAARRTFRGDLYAAAVGADA